MTGIETVRIKMSDISIASMTQSNRFKFYNKKER